MSGDQPPYPGGKAAERRREQLARELGEESPEGAGEGADAEGEKGPDDEPAEDNGDSTESKE